MVSKNLELRENLLDGNSAYIDSRHKDKLEDSGVKSVRLLDILISPH